MRILALLLALTSLSGCINSKTGQPYARLHPAPAPHPVCRDAKPNFPLYESHGDGKTSIIFC